MDSLDTHLILLPLPVSRLAGVFSLVTFVGGILTIFHSILYMAHLPIDELYIAEHDRLTRYCYALTRSKEDAEDASQEAFSRLMIQPGVHNQTQYLYRIAYTTSIGIIKMRQTECQLSPHCADIQEQDQPYDYECLHTAIKTLPARESAAIWLRYWERMSYIEIAAKMGVTAKAVDRLLDKAKKHLREMISKIEAA
jgi:RNA polymerase sigma-70 factor, ECF subfamily